jgi:NAD+ synthase
MTQDEAGQTAASFQEEIDVFEIYKRLNNANRHKMDTIPVCFVKMIKNHILY